MKNCIVLVALCIMMSSYSLAQRNAISLNLSDASFEHFIAELEKQSSFRFFYPHESTDSLRISIQAQAVPLEEVLEAVLTPSKLYFAFDQQRRVYITATQPMITQLAYFQGSGPQNPLLEEPQRKQERVLFSIENQVFDIGDKDNPSAGPNVLSGYVRFEETGSPLSNVTVAVSGHPNAVQTDAFGHYSLSIPDKRSTVTFRRSGLQETSRQVVMHTSGKLDVQMNDQVFALREVLVTTDLGGNINRSRMGVERLNVKMVKQTPALLGEADVINVILTLPGVQSVGEASSGFNVRGGATDQNLVLFGDATIFNSSHFFGMFSAFNADAVSQIELYKSSIPAKYGGRIASVLDVATRQGNKKKFSGAGGIGLLTSRLSFEGPIGSKTAFLAGVRTTYSDWLLQRIPDENYKNSSAGFLDGHLIVDHDFNEKNQVILTAYGSSDNYEMNNGIQYGYGNQNINLKYRHSVNRKLYGFLSVGNDYYHFRMGDLTDLQQAYQLRYSIQQQFARLDINQRIGTKHQLAYGIHALRYQVQPGRVQPMGETSLRLPQSLAQEQALETATYLSDLFTVNDKLTIDVGIRFSMYHYLGPRTVRNYVPGMPLSEETAIGVTAYEKGKVIQDYQSPEIRASIKYAFHEQRSLKLSYNSLRQYLHMLSNTTAITPTDSWKLSDEHIRPQFGDQVSLGYYHNFNQNQWESSLEVYYKRIDNYLDYKSGAKLLMNEAIETDVIGTEAKAYGAEFQIKKVAGKLNGWMGYTWSRILQRTRGKEFGESINNDQYYPGNYDKPHSFTSVANYRFSHRFSVSAVATYSTGRPITLPIGIYHYAGSERVFYSNRNEYRIPDYFRTDLSLNIEGNHKIKKLAHSSWTIGVYNVTGRKNPFSVYFLSENGKINGYKTSILGTQLPFITYNFKF